MLNIFSRLAAGEEMPVREKTRVRRGRTAAHRPRGARQHPRRGTACPQARRRYRRLGWQQAMLLLWVVISAGLLAVALVLNNSGHKACIRSMGTTCPSPSIPQHANASHVMHLRLLAEACRHGQSAGCAIVRLDPQAHMIATPARARTAARARRPAGYLS